MGLSSALKTLAEDMVAGLKMAASPGRDAGVFIGPRFATDEELLRLDRARAELSRRAAKKDPMTARERVWQDTGWFGWGDDGLTLKYPQMRVSDHGARLNPEIADGRPVETTLGAALPHPELSPRMGKIYDEFPLHIGSYGAEGARFVRRNDTFALTPLRIDLGTENFRPGARFDPRASVLHEVTHYDQSLNGQPNGGSPDHDRFWNAQDEADAKAIAGVLALRGQRPSDGWSEFSDASSKAAQELGIQDAVRSKIVSALTDFQGKEPGSPAWFDAHPARQAFFEHMNLPLLKGHAVYRHGGFGRGELPAWQTYYEALDDLPPEQLKNVPPFRTMFPQSLHATTHDDRVRRIKAIADTVRTAGGAGLLGAALSLAGRAREDQDMGAIA